MAGTRLWTQVAFVLGVAILFVPPALYVHEVHRAPFPQTLPFPSNLTTADCTILPTPTISINVYQIVSSNVNAATPAALDWNRIISGNIAAGRQVIITQGEDLTLPSDISSHLFDAEGDVRLEEWFNSLSLSPLSLQSPLNYALLLLPPHKEQVRHPFTVPTQRVLNHHARHAHPISPLLLYPNSTMDREQLGLDWCLVDQAV